MVGIRSVPSLHNNLLQRLVALGAGMVEQRGGEKRG
jgi:hypothetical protein